MLPHEQAAELLPWLVNNSLDGDEKVAVLEHARACVICRRELGEFELLRDSISQTSAALPTPAPDMRSINARIDALTKNRRWGWNWLPPIRETFENPWRIAFAVQSVLLIVLISLLLSPEPQNREFTTLTRPDNLPDGFYVRLVFSPELPQSELSTLLDKYELKVVQGPSARGVYTLGFKESLSIEDRDNRVKRLQEDPEVLFAQLVTRDSDQ
jgi:hypothetical protein